jgi:hypothetical protein
MDGGSWIQHLEYSAWANTNLGKQNKREIKEFTNLVNLRNV